jgi:hypothetical protein
VVVVVVVGGWGEGAVEINQAQCHVSDQSIESDSMRQTSQTLTKVVRRP